jgi:adenine-specific DNA methylase
MTKYNGANSTLGDFPVVDISNSGVREKSIRQGHLSTLQFWWARRPMGVCRSVIFASLRPSDLKDIPTKLLAELKELYPDLSSDEARITAFTARLAEWNVIDCEEELELARKILMSHRDVPAVVVDPFSGGGSIPVESLRLGLESYAGELHPIAVTALKIALEGLPQSNGVVQRFTGIAERIGRDLSDSYEKLYPSENRPLAYLWCKTFVCPNCNAETPLLRNLKLAQKPRSAVVLLSKCSGKVAYQVVPDATKNDLKVAAEGTVSERGGVCVVCNERVNAEFLRLAGKEHLLGDHLYAVHELDEAGNRYYRSPTDEEKEKLKLLKSPSEVPSVDLDWNGVRHLWALQYGITKTSDLHSNRQLIALNLLVEKVKQVIDALETDGSEAKNKDNETIALLLAVTVNRIVMYGNRHVWWQSNGEFPANIFVRQGIGMVWSYAEMPVNSPGAAGWESATKWVSKVAKHLQKLPRTGTVVFGDACNLSLEDKSVDLVFTDPPYYDSITYGYLADVFVPWTRAIVGERLTGELYGLPVNRSAEAIVDRPHISAPDPKDDSHFRKTMLLSFSEMRRVLKPEGTVILMYGHKQPKAWAAFLDSLLTSGLIPVETWPIHTERKAKFKHNKITALSTSCVILCKVRNIENHKEEIKYWDFIDSLYTDIVGIIKRFESYGINGSDLGAALLAPIVTHWSKFIVFDNDGKEISLTKLFENIGEVVRDFEKRYLTDCFLSEFGEDWVNQHSQIGDISVDTISDSNALNYVRSLYGGKIIEADIIASTSDLYTLKSALRFLALSAPADSPFEKACVSGIGRLSMQGRGELPGSFSI